MNDVLEPTAPQRTSGGRKSNTPFASAASSEAHQPVFSRPRYHCKEQPDTLTLVIHVPDADPTGVDLEVDAPDLTITATRDRTRAPARLVAVVHDYQLRLRLGFSLAYDALKADLRGGTLTVTIPKKGAVSLV
jgi:HSP20 family molecular chaperone IbpA